MVGDWPKSRLAHTLGSVVFFGLLYVYLWLVVEPQLLYSSGTITNFPAFYTDGAFLRDCLSYPGGLLKYLCALGPQFFYHSWAGALVIAAQAGALVIGTGWLFRALAVPGERVLRLVPALLVLTAYARYSFHFSTITGSLAALLFGRIYLAVASRAQPAISIAAYLLLSVVSYIISAGAFLPFVVLCAIHASLYRRRHALGLACLLVGAVLPYLIGVLVFHVSIVNAYTDLLPLSWQIRGWSTRERMITAVYALHLFPIVVVLLEGLWQRLDRRRRPVPDPEAGVPTPAPGPKGRKPVPPTAQRTKSRRAGLWHWRPSPALGWALESSLLLAVAAGVAFVALDRRQKALLQVHHYACHRMWPQVLQAAHRYPGHYTVAHAVNRALYHAGRLNRDMFAYVQQPEALMLTGEDHVLLYWHKFDTLIDLGLLNLAEKNFAECLATFGEHPMLLQRLALINLAKGKSAAARIYLGRLSRTLFFGPWARDCLARLAADPTLAGDRRVQQMRASALRQDFPGFFYAPEPMLLALARQGGQNRMAFEYLMAWYLAHKQLGPFVQQFERLSEFGYTEIPPLYQEAAMIYSTKYPVPIGGFQVDPDIRRRFEHFSSIYNRCGRDKEAAFPELVKDYARSYFFYFIYAAIPARR